MVRCPHRHGLIYSSQPSCVAGLIIFPEEANEARIPPGSLKMVTDKVSFKFIKKKKKTQQGDFGNYPDSFSLDKL